MVRIEWDREEAELSFVAAVVRFNVAILHDQPREKETQNGKKC